MRGREKKKAVRDKFKSKRSRILYEIAALLIVVLIASGLMTFFIVRSSQNRMVEKSIDKLVENDVKNVYSSYNYVANLLVPTYEERLKDMSEQELIVAILNKQLTEAQKFINDEFQKMVDKGLLGLETIMVVLPPSELYPGDLILACNNESLIYGWEIPQYILDAFEEGTPYLWMEDGIPELELEGEYAIIVAGIEGEGPYKEAIQPAMIALRPMHEDIAEIEDFYNQEKRNMSIILALVISSSIAVAVLIVLFVLSFLIRRRITEPIDELSAAAEEVMEGNLDVEIEVRKGEEFEGLKRTFKEMVENFRKIIAKSVGEE